ncbi:hypothetical protein JHW43_002904 [Diplocarpon mali]|nr:hypothetical protein JHW43_002904 [Diplocarpon mali]
MEEAHDSKQAMLHPTAMQYADVAWNLKYLQCQSELIELLAGEALKRARTMHLSKRDEKRVINLKKSLQKNKVVATEELEAAQRAAIKAQIRYHESRTPQNLPPLEPQFHIDAVDNPQLLQLKKRYDVLREALHMSSTTISAEEWAAMNLCASGRRKLYADSQLVRDLNESRELPCNFSHGIGTPTEDFETEEAGCGFQSRNILFAGFPQLFAALSLGLDGFPTDGALNDTYQRILGIQIEGGLPLLDLKGRAEADATASEDVDMDGAESGDEAGGASRLFHQAEDGPASGNAGHTSQQATAPAPARRRSQKAAIPPAAAAAAHPAPALTQNPYGRATPYAPTPQAKNPALNLKWHLVKGNPPPAVTAVAWDRAFRNAYAKRFNARGKNNVLSRADNASGLTRDEAISRLIREGVVRGGFADTNP